MRENVDGTPPPTRLPTSGQAVTGTVATSDSPSGSGTPRSTQPTVLCARPLSARTSITPTRSRIRTPAFSPTHRHGDESSALPLQAPASAPRANHCSGPTLRIPRKVNRLGLGPIWIGVEGKSARQTNSPANLVSLYAAYSIRVSKTALRFSSSLTPDPAFRHSKFRGRQEEVIEAAVLGKHLLGGFRRSLTLFIRLRCTCHRPDGNGQGPWPHLSLKVHPLNICNRACVFKCPPSLPKYVTYHRAFCASS